MKKLSVQRSPCVALVCGLSLCLAAVPFAAANKTRAGSVGQPAAVSGITYSLFDGKTLNGWTVENDCEAEVSDGMILLKAGNGWLRSDHVYADFRLHIECKALQAKNFDAGIYLRTVAGGKPFPKGYQANLLQGKVGNIGNLKGATSTGLDKPAGEWNVFEIEVIGEHVAMTINGKPAYKVGGITNAVGHIGIQIEVPKGGQFLVRNVQVTELNYQSLFNGKDMAGWEGAGKPAETCWQVEDGVLQCTGKNGPWLRTLKQYDDFNLRMEYQVSPGGNSGIYVRVPENGSHHRDDDTKPPAGFEIQVLDDAAPKYAKLKDYQYTGSVYDIAGATSHVGRPAGQWNTLELNCKQNQIRTTHNGVVIVDVDPEDFPKLKLRQLKGFLGLQNHSTVVKYRRLRIGPAMD